MTKQADDLMDTMAQAIGMMLQSLQTNNFQQLQQVAPQVNARLIQQYEAWKRTRSQILSAQGAPIPPPPPSRNIQFDTVGRKR